MCSDYPHPLNLGTDRAVSINMLVDIVAAIAGKTVVKKHDCTKPQGVRGRNSDNRRMYAVLGREPAVSLEEGLTRTYGWIEEQLRKSGRLPVSPAAVASGSPEPQDAMAHHWNGE